MFVEGAMLNEDEFATRQVWGVGGNIQAVAVAGAKTQENETV